MSDPESFIATLELDARSFERLQGWRSLHFPVARNYLPAHLTLFHTLSRTQLERLTAARQDFESQQPISLRFSKPRSLGNGVAIEVESARLLILREALVRVFGDPLTRQDQQRFRGHVTIQNKVDADTASALMRLLHSQFEAWEGDGTAILIWKYLGGPWRFEERITFIASDRK